MIENSKGIVRSKEELREVKKESRRSKFKLKEQNNFKGSAELLEKMQDMERAYREGKPIISDEEWDLLVKQTGYEESLDEIISPNGRMWVKLGAPLGSLNKITNIEGLKLFLKKLANNFGEDSKILVQPKLDGLTFNAIYRETLNGDYELDKITTRGDGLNGLALSDGALLGVNIDLPKIIYKDNLSLIQNMIKDSRIELRGEAVIKKSEWSNKNDYSDILPRSIVAGIFNRKTPNNLTYFINNNFNYLDPNIKHSDFTKSEIKLLKKWGINPELVYIYNNTLFNNNSTKYSPEEFNNDKLRSYESVDFVVFSYVDLNGNNVSDNKLNILSNIGFNTIINNDILKDYCGEFDLNDLQRIISIVDLAYGCNNLIRDYSKPRNKNLLEYAIDGIVVKLKDSNTKTQNMSPYEKNGKIIVPKYPVDQVAIKLQTDPVKSKVLKIKYITTKLGNKTCSAEIEPVVVEGGAIVSRVNLHNPNWLQLPQNQWIKEGVECGVIMAMDIIPILIPLSKEWLN